MKRISLFVLILCFFLINCLTAEESDTFVMFKDIGGQSSSEYNIIYKDSLVIIFIIENTELSEVDSLFVSALGSIIQACLYDSNTRDMFIEALLLFNAKRIKQLEEGLSKED